VNHLCDEETVWVATAGQVASWWLAREALELEDTQAAGDEWRWRYRAGRDVGGMTLVLTGANCGQVTVVGANAAIEQPLRAQETGEVRLELEPLAAGQVFEIVLAREGADP
jgi:hypothetical protein